MIVKDDRSPHIVIFGAAVRADGSPSGTLKRRVSGALAAMRDEPDAVFIPTGAVGLHGPAEADIMATILESAGVAKARIVPEREGHDTMSSVVCCAAIIATRRASVGRVLVCSSRYHNPRCAWLLRLLGIRASWPRMPSDCGHVPAAKLLRFYAREVPAIIWDTMVLLTLIAAGRVKRVAPLD